MASSSRCRSMVLIVTSCRTQYIYGVCVYRSGSLLTISINPFPAAEISNFVITSLNIYRLKTFSKRIFPRCRALLSALWTGRDASSA